MREVFGRVTASAPCASPDDDDEPKLCQHCNDPVDPEVIRHAFTALFERRVLAAEGKVK